MKKQRILQAVEQMLHRFPEASIIDIYKSFYQDEFGPGHLLGDVHGARDYFFKELAGMRSSGRHTLEPCGTGSRFFRAPLDVIVDGIIPPEEFLSGFFEGASLFTLPDITEWGVQWKEILAAAEPVIKGITGIEDDLKVISEALQSRSGAVRHSRRYAEAYEPHYRIIPVGGTLHQKLR